MKFFDRPLKKGEINNLNKNCGAYIKVTVDIEKHWLVAGGELHADGEKILLEKGSRQDDIWGGGINLKERMIDTTAVLNIRPRLNNPSLEILDAKIRDGLVKIIKEFFKHL